MNKITLSLQQMEDIFESVDFDRPGSHWTDWYYGFRESGQKSFEWPEVTKVEVVTYKWRVVK